MCLLLCTFVAALVSYVPHSIPQPLPRLGVGFRAQGSGLYKSLNIRHLEDRRTRASRFDDA